MLDLRWELVTGDVLVPVDVEGIALGSHQDMQKQLIVPAMSLQQPLYTLPTKHMFPQHDNKLTGSCNPQLQHKFLLPLGQHITATLKHAILVHTSIGTVEHQTFFRIMLVVLCGVRGIIGDQRLFILVDFHDALRLLLQLLCTYPQHDVGVLGLEVDVVLDVSDDGVF